jgi:hypothetical protein
MLCLYIYYHVLPKRTMHRLFHMTESVLSFILVTSAGITQDFRPSGIEFNNIKTP